MSMFFRLWVQFRVNIRPWRRRLGVLVLVLGGLAPGYSIFHSIVPGNVYCAGETTLTVTLRDASTAILNKGTCIEFNFTTDARNIHLLKGEAMFLVQHNPDWPFRVWTDDKTVAEARGTAFTVRTEGGQTDVVVTQGRVRVFNATKESTLVETGYAVSVWGGVETTRRLADSELNDRLRWVDLFPGNATPELGEIVYQLNRVNELQLVIDDDAIEHIPVGVVLVATDPTSFAQALAGYKTPIKSIKIVKNGKITIHLFRSKSGR